MRASILAFICLAGVARAEVPQVATDIAPVHGLVAEVMDGLSTPALIVPTGTSPHHHAMRPSEARALAQADLVIWVGPTLTPWLERPVRTLGEGAQELRLMDVPGVQLLPYREGALFEAHDHGDDAEHGPSGDHGHGEQGHGDHGQEAHDDHAHGAHEEQADGHESHDHENHASDDHAHAAGGMDPHLWLDPENARRWVAVIAEVLAETDPQSAQAYRDNAAAAAARIDAAEAEIAATLAPFAGTRFVVLHDAYHYFEARFGVEASGAISAGDATTPGAARIAKLRARLRELGVACVFAEPQMNTALIDTATEGLDVRIGTLDPLGAAVPEGPGHYAASLRAMGAAMAECLAPA